MRSSWKRAFYVTQLESIRAQHAFDAFGILPFLSGEWAFQSLDEAVRFIATGKGCRERSRWACSLVLEPCKPGRIPVIFDAVARTLVDS
jgi:hypothetical protein